ncbi:MAG: DNA repair protein RadA [Anaerolineales bacterium]
MAKTRLRYVCRECGRTTPRPMGRCPQCGGWNTLVEEAVVEARPSHRAQADRSAPKRLGEIDAADLKRLPMAQAEFARVLGGGIVPGSVVLIGGDPGVGKSTLLLQAAGWLAATQQVLYVSGEESEAQIRDRARRLPSDGGMDSLYLLHETDLESIVSQLEAMRPSLAVIDSIQTVVQPDLGSEPGSITQIRQAASRLQAVAKATGVAIFLVGHVTKDGALAGPRLLEHVVDTVLYLEGDPYHAYRLLRAVKNRFGPTTEVGVFEMRGDGMAEVANPSQAFLAERVLEAPGSAVAVTLEGSRPLLVEIQGLTSPTAFGHPRRTANGVDLNRLLLTIAVLTRRVGIPLGEEDVFVNVVGGLRVEEPAADLAIAVAIASSVRDRPVAADVVLMGEVGLSGEVRAVGQLGARLREASQMGFGRAIVPPGPAPEPAPPPGLELLRAKTVRQALDLALGKRSG